MQNDSHVIYGHKSSKFALRQLDDLSSHVPMPAALWGQWYPPCAAMAW